jgi:curved DNA-binding protein CbpA
VVSRAFQILSDADKKARYDKFGGDPDSRFGAGAGPSAASSPFGGFGGGGFSRGQAAGGSMFEEEISPEELFNRFFGGGGMGGGFSPFGKSSVIAAPVLCYLLTLLEADHSLFSIWEVAPVSESINSVASGLGDGRKMPTARLNRHRPAGRPSRNCYL